MKRINLVTLFILFFTLVFTTNVSAHPFPDLVPWAEDHIIFLQQEGIISGYPNGKFGSNDPVKRGDAALMLAKAKKLDIVDVKISDSYADVSKAIYYAKAIQATTNAGYFSGYPDGLFKPTETLSRQEMARIISVAYDLTSTDHVDFPDIANSWAKDHISAIVSNGIAIGYPDGTFQPNKQVTRAEFSVMLAKAMKIPTKPDKEEEPEKIEPPTQEDSNSQDQPSEDSPSIDDPSNQPTENIKWSRLNYEAIKINDKLYGYHSNHYEEKNSLVTLPSIFELEINGETHLITPSYFTVQTDFNDPTTLSTRSSLLNLFQIINGDFYVIPTENIFVDGLIQLGYDSSTPTITNNDLKQSDFKLGYKEFYVSPLKKQIDQWYEYKGKAFRWPADYQDQDLIFVDKGISFFNKTVDEDYYEPYVFINDLLDYWGIDAKLSRGSDEDFDYIEFTLDKEIPEAEKPVELKQITYEAIKINNHFYGSYTGNNHAFSNLPNIFELEVNGEKHLVTESQVQVYNYYDNELSTSSSLFNLIQIINGDFYVKPANNPFIDGLIQLEYASNNVTTTSLDLEHSDFKLGYNEFYVSPLKKQVDQWYEYKGIEFRSPVNHDDQETIFTENGISFYNRENYYDEPYVFINDLLDYWGIDAELSWDTNENINYISFTLDKEFPEIEEDKITELTQFNYEAIKIDGEFYGYNEFKSSDHLFYYEMPILYELKINDEKHIMINRSLHHDSFRLLQIMVGPYTIKPTSNIFLDGLIDFTYDDLLQNDFKRGCKETQVSPSLIEKDEWCLLHNKSTEYCNQNVRRLHK